MHRGASSGAKHGRKSENPGIAFEEWKTRRSFGRHCICAGVPACVGGAVINSHFGLRGTEDLGSGLKAVFDVENNFKPRDGSLGDNGRLFDSLASASRWRNTHSRSAPNSTARLISTRSVARQEWNCRVAATRRVLQSD